MRISTVFAWGLIGGVVGCGGKTSQNPQRPDTPVVDPGPGADPSRHAYIATVDPLNEPVTKVVYLKQNWTPDESLRYYFTPQGSQLIPYDWFLALEQANATTLFRDNQNMLKYRCLPQNKGPLNPDGLPAGFVGGEVSSRRWMGLSCAACHATEIRLGDTGYRVDGAPTHADVQGFLVDMIGAMRQTLDDPAKFERFAVNVLGTKDNPANREDLKTELAKLIKVRVGYNLRNFVGYDPDRTAPQTPTRFGRLDAVDAIVNEVYWHAVKDPDLDKPTVVARPADALVSYPCLWDTPQHDRVEWLGIAKGGGPNDLFSLSRNVGEVLGVFADFTIPNDPSLLNLGYPSSVKFAQLMELENLLKTLWSPLWPDEFPTIDQAAAAKGSQLYQANLEGKGSCFDCHKLIKRDDPNRTVVADVKATGTDVRAFENFFLYKRPSGKLNGVNIDFVPDSAKIPPEADASSMLSNVTIGVIRGSSKEAPLDALKQANFVDKRNLGLVAATSREAASYKGRPLNGVWATAPYLHNGSVPTLDALLRPAKDRPKSFSIGVRTFDPVKVGYLTDVPGFPKFMVDLPDGTPTVGNSNAGHEYGTNLSDEERGQLIEYLKTL